MANEKDTGGDSFVVESQIRQQLMLSAHSQFVACFLSNPGKWPLADRRWMLKTLDNTRQLFLPRKGEEQNYAGEAADNTVTHDTDAN